MKPESRLNSAEAVAAAKELWHGPRGAEPLPVWLDCDTGHDDAFAILLAAHSPRLRLLGISTVHGNASLDNTTSNTLRILEAIGRRDVPVYPGASKPFCRETVHAESIHGASGLDGTTVLPAAKSSPASGQGGAITAMHDSLSKEMSAGRKAWIIATGALTNIALLFAVYPELAAGIGGLSIMGGAVGGFFTHAPLGRVKERVNLTKRIYLEFPGGLPDDSGKSIPEVAKHLRELGILQDVDDIEDERIHLLLEEARQSFGNWTPYAEFNIYCDPEAAASIFTSPVLAAKTTLVPLDLTHQVLGDDDALHLLRYGSAGNGSGEEPNDLRKLFHEIITFFASTYEKTFGMSTGPPLHDPVAVAAVFAPEIFDDQGGERYEVFVVREGDDAVFHQGRNPEYVGQCGRTIVRQTEKGRGGVRIPRSLNVEEFWHVLDLALATAEKCSPMVGYFA